ncbi:hypothetical protein DSO57_1031001 [Entomophthora muscae]|uniref:Uncharacterized protein n=1 Tax=Entomophthora muscae TaxID=34485 RepID=A0ACC2SPT6_9FUNG|nr:hypothetical protein DSO57_1031001 [Entomophthora muscae]
MAVSPEQSTKILNLSCLLVQLGAALTIGILSLALFAGLRIKWPALHYPKSRFHSYSPPLLTNSLFGWIIDLVGINEEQILDLIGLDAVMILRFFKLSRTLFFICSVYGVFVLLSLTLSNTSSNILDSYPSKDNFTVSGLRHDDLRLIGHCIGVYVFTLTSFYLFDREYQIFCHLRWSYLKSNQSNITARSVLVQGVPEKFRQEDSFSSFLNVLNVGKAEKVVFYQHAPELSKLLAKRMKVLLKTEHLITKWLRNPWVSDSFTTEDVRLSLEQNTMLQIDNKKRPTLQTELFGRKVDAINYYYQILKKLDASIQKARNDKPYPASSLGFITFKSIHSAHYASQVLTNSSLSKFRITLAPEPRDIIWSNFVINSSEVFVRNAAAWLATLIVTVLYVAAMPNICYLDSQRIICTHLDLPSGEHQFFVRCLKMVLIPALITGFTSITPRIFGMVSKLQGATSYSAAQWSTASKHFVFLLIIWFSFAVLPVCRKQGLECFYYSSFDFETLVQSLPNASPLFISFVIVSGIVGFPLQLLQPGRVLLFTLKRFFCSTPRDFAGLLAPVHLNYGWLYGQPMFVFVIVMTYSVYSPLILIFGTIYFFVGHIVLKYLLLYVFCRRYESSGLAWPKVFRRLMLGVFLLQTVMVGVFSLKLRFDLAIAILPLLMFSIWFCYYISRSYPKDCQFLPTDFLHEGSAPQAQPTELPSLPPPNQSETIRITITSSRSSALLPADDFDGFLSSTARVSGVLDSSIVQYENPAIVGRLPSLWLPCAITTLRFLGCKGICSCFFPISNWSHLAYPFTSPRPRSQRGSFSSYVEVRDFSLPEPCPSLLIQPNTPAPDHPIN